MRFFGSFGSLIAKTGMAEGVNKMLVGKKFQDNDEVMNSVMI